MSLTVVFFIDDIELVGGTERAGLKIASILARDSKYKVFVFSAKGKKSNISFDYSEQISFFSLEQKETGKFRHYNTVVKLSNFIRSRKVDILVSLEALSFVFTFSALLISKTRKNVKYVLWEHFNYTVDLGMRTRKICRVLASRFADDIVTLTESDKRMWINKLSPIARVTAIPNATPYENEQNVYDPNSKTIIAIGRFTYQKGFDRLLNIIRLIKSDIKNIGWNFTIIGEGELESSLQSYIEKEGLGDQVRILPNTQNVQEVYRSAACLCMTSRFEGLPMVLIEAQSFGLPCIAYDCITGPSDIIVDGSGFLISEGDSMGYAEALKEIVNDSDLRVKMSASAFRSSKRFWNDPIKMAWDKVLTK